MHMHMGRGGLHTGMSRDTERVLKEGEHSGHNEVRWGIYVYQKNTGMEMRGFWYIMAKVGFASC